MENRNAGDLAGIINFHFEAERLSTGLDRKCEGEPGVVRIEWFRLIVSCSLFFSCSTSLGCGSVMNTE